MYAGLASLPSVGSAVYSASLRELPSVGFSASLRELPSVGSVGCVDQLYLLPSATSTPPSLRYGRASTKRFESPACRHTAQASLPCLPTSLFILLRRKRDSNPRFTDRRTTVFKTAAFDRSAIPPRAAKLQFFSLFRLFLFKNVSLPCYY